MGFPKIMHSNFGIVFLGVLRVLGFVHGHGHIGKDHHCHKYIQTVVSLFYIELCYIHEQNMNDTYYTVT